MPSAAELLESLESEFPNTVQQRVRSYSLKDAYKTVSWVYSAVNLIADSISGVELFFYRQDGNGDQVPLDKLKEPVVWCFYPPRPNEIPTLSEMVKMQFLHLGLFGESFMMLEMKGKYPDRIDLISPLNITPIISKDGKTIERWKVRQQEPGGTVKEILVPTTQIVQWKYPNPYNKFRGMAPLTAARLSIEQDLNMATWNAGFFQNGLRNPIALMLKQTFNEPQRKEYMNRMKQNFTGFVKGQLPLLVEGGVDVRVLQNTMKDLDFANGKELTREELATVYGTPPALVGIYRHANYSNVKEQTNIFYNAALKPKMVYYRDVFQQAILNIYFPGIICDWEWDSVAAFKEDPLVKAQVDAQIIASAVQLWSMGYTQQQIAYILDKEELDPMTHIVAAPPEPEIPEPEIPKSHRPRFSKSKTHTVIHAERLFYSGHAQAVYDEVVSPLVRKLSTFTTSYWSKYVVSVKRSDATAFWTRQWRDEVSKTLQAAYDAGVADTLDILKPKQVALEYPADKVKLEEKIHNWNYAMMETIYKVVIPLSAKERKIKASEVVPALVDKLQPAAVIHKMYNMGRYAVLEKLDVEEIALCAGDDEHKSLNGISVKMGEEFPTLGMQYPGQNGDSTCRCTIYPVSIRRPEEKVQIVKDLTQRAAAG